MAMRKVKSKPAPVKKIIWRMSGNAPLGEYLSGAGANSPAATADSGDLILSSQSSWRLSSVELLDGLHVSEQPLDTLPGELLDEFFKR